MARGLVRIVQALFDQLAEDSPQPKRLLGLKAMYAGGRLPYGVSLHSALADMLLCEVNPSSEGLRIGTSRRLQKLLERNGYRHDILTHQEHLLAGSSGTDFTSEEFPYTPGGVLGGMLTVEEAQVARGLQRVHKMINAYFSPHFNPSSTQVAWVYATLELLNPKGETVRDPRLAQVAGRRVRVLETTLAPYAPYARR